MASTFASHRPSGLRGLILSNAVASSEAWDVAYDGYRRHLSQDIQLSIDQHGRDGTTESEEYKAIITEFNTAHFCNVQPLPAECQ